MKRHLIIACCMMLLIIPFQVKANEIEDLEITKYYKTITYENNDFVEQEIITHTKNNDTLTLPYDPENGEHELL